jgi:hypothetical protein
MSGYAPYKALARPNPRRVFCLCFLRETSVFPAHFRGDFPAIAEFSSPFVTSDVRLTP